MREKEQMDARFAFASYLRIAEKAHSVVVYNKCVVSTNIQKFVNIYNMKHLNRKSNES